MVSSRDLSLLGAEALVSQCLAALANSLIMKIRLDVKGDRGIGTYLVEVVEHLDGGLPVNTGIGDTDTVLKGAGTGIGNILPASIDVGFNHDTGNVALATGELRTDVVNNEGLVVVVLLRVAVC